MLDPCHTHALLCHRNISPCFVTTEKGFLLCLQVDCQFGISIYIPTHALFSAQASCSLQPHLFPVYFFVTYSHSYWTFNSLFPFISSHLLLWQHHSGFLPYFQNMITARAFIFFKQGVLTALLSVPFQFGWVAPRPATLLLF